MSSRLRYLSSANVHGMLFLFVLPLIPALFFVDSTWLAQRVSYNQWLANLMALLGFIWVYGNSTRTLRRLMLYGIPVAILGECLLSLVLGMYEYRLHNVPLYVFLGHSLVFAAIYHLTRTTIFKGNMRLANRMWFIAMVLSIAWLLLNNDLFGFICFLGFSLVIYKNPSARSFYVCMYLLVAYLELIGTALGCWGWPDTWFGKVEWMPSGNPPIGIALFYFGFDLSCFWLYRRFNRPIWNRSRRIQYFRRGETPPARYSYAPSS